MRTTLYFSPYPTSVSLSNLISGLRYIPTRDNQSEYLITNLQLARSLSKREADLLFRPLHRHSSTVYVIVNICDFVVYSVSHTPSKFERKEICLSLFELQMIMIRLLLLLLRADVSYFVDIPLI